VGSSSIELRPTHIGPGERDGHTQGFRIELKGAFPFDHVRPVCIELEIQDRLSSGMGGRRAHLLMSNLSAANQCSSTTEKNECRED
jgi:hypothetical protein